MTNTMTAILAEAGALQPFGTLIVLAILAGLAAFGFQYGLFLATLVGLGAIATMLVALGLGEAVASLLVAVEMPADYALPVSVGALAVGGALAVRFAIGSEVSDGALRFSPLIDRIGGVFIGGMAGMVVAGTLLVVLSVMPIPPAYRIDGTQTKYDLGTRMLKTFARLVAPDTIAREVLLHGEGPAAESVGGFETSELFVDTNGNGLFDGEGDAAERYLDHDGNNSFTPRVAFSDANSNGVRDVGLLERYRLGAWQNLRVMHYPTITSGTSSVLGVVLGDGQEVYKATATDLDPDDQITFSLRAFVASMPQEAPAEANEAVADQPKPESAEAGELVIAPAADAVTGDEMLFAIDPASGSVTVQDAKAFMRRTEPSQIVVVATDQRGLVSEKNVTLTYRGVVPSQ